MHAINLAIGQVTNGFNLFGHAIGELFFERSNLVVGISEILNVFGHRRSDSTASLSIFNHVFCGNPRRIRIVKCRPVVRGIGICICVRLKLCQDRFFRFFLGVQIVFCRDVVRRLVQPFDGQFLVGVQCLAGQRFRFLCLDDFVLNDERFRWWRRGRAALTTIMGFGGGGGGAITTGGGGGAASTTGAGAGGCAMTTLITTFGL